MTIGIEGNDDAIALVANYRALSKFVMLNATILGNREVFVHDPEMSSLVLAVGHPDCYFIAIDVDYGC